MLISVILPVYNAQPFLAAALESIQTQTCADFECIVIDDGSTDAGGNTADQYAARDSRFRVVPTPNRGLVAALNDGISLARGKYLARMDADDISMPERFATQVAFLENHPDIAVCGTFARSMGESPPQLIKHPTDPDFIFASLLFRNALIHPTVMMRRDIQPRYDPAFKHCEDYELWARLAPQYRFANIPEILLHYRVHAAQVSVEHRRLQLSATEKVQVGLLQQLGISPTSPERALHSALANNQLECSQRFLEDADAWLRRILAANAERTIFPARALAVTLASRWLAVSDACQSLATVAERFKASPLYPYLDLRLRPLPWLADQK